jgi:hypothetical protein
MKHTETMQHRLPSWILLGLMSGIGLAGATPPEIAPATETANMAEVRLSLGETLGPTRPEVVGLNVNAFLDHADARARGEGMAAALRRAGVRSLRWPGGEKSDALAWSTPPFEASRLTLIRTGPGEWPSSARGLVAEDGRTWLRPPLEFDEFIALCREVGAEPVVVVAFDSMYKPSGPGGVAPTRQQLLELAAAWVRYANIERGYGVKWWELGNESYFASYNGGAKAADYARDFVAFADAMRAVDPAIQLGANADLLPDRPGQLDRAEGDARGWLPTLLEVAGDHMDFLAVHDYPCYGWGSYAPYEAGGRNLAFGIRNVDTQLAEWEGKTGRRIRMAVTEFHSADWRGHPKNEGWQHVNNLGHALVAADQIGGYLATPRVAHAQLWNTRWTKNETAPELWDTLDAENRLLPAGEMLALWSGALLDEVVSVEAAPAGTRLLAFAQRSQDGTRLRMMVINPAREPLALRLDGAWNPIRMVGISGAHPDATELVRINRTTDDIAATRALIAPGYSLLRIEWTRP